MKRCLLFLFTWTLFLSVSFAQQDSTFLTYADYLENILKYHPVARQANLQLQLADAEWLAARGNFDPEINSDWSQKQYDDKLYYRKFRSHFKVPTPLGIDVVGGYENMEGVFLNPENSTDEFGLWNLGVEVDLIQGLFVNERRTAIRQARIFRNMSINQQAIMLNELLYMASVAYLDWQKYYFFEEVIDESIDLAERYLENTKQSFFGGEKTAIDTLEALILYQEAITLRLQNESALFKSRQTVENFLWFNDLPLALQAGIQPQDYRTPAFSIDNEFDISRLSASHPKIQEKLNKRSYLELEQRLKREKLKPKLKAKYNPLLATSENSIAPNYSISDYKVGLDFSMPILFRSERAEVQKAQIKIQDVTYDLQNTQNSLQNKIENSWQQQTFLQQQFAIQEQNVQGYLRLLEAENEKFNFGESSVFLLNKRQEKYINGQLKLIELNIKLQLEMLNYLYFTNQLIEN